jgi:Splicing factor 3B subunit 1.
MTPEQIQAYRWEREIDERNRPLTDDELEAMFPPGYKVLQPPAGECTTQILLIQTNRKGGDSLDRER